MGDQRTSMSDLGGDFKEQVILDIAGFAICFLGGHCAVGRWFSKLVGVRDLVAGFGLTRSKNCYYRRRPRTGAVRR
jgi:hypothetical protein